MKNINRYIEDLLYKGTVHLFSRKMIKNNIESIVGIENLPEKGPYIIVANHSSFADHYLLLSYYYYGAKTRLKYLTKKESFETWHSRTWHNALGCIPVNRDKTDVNSIKNMIKCIKDGEIVVIYPEGTRGHGNSLLPFKSGAFKMAAMLRVPIVPFGFIDANKVMVKGSTKLHNAKAQILVGKPISVKEIKEIGPEGVMEKCKNNIEEMVYGNPDPLVKLNHKETTARFFITQSESIIETVLEEGMKPTHKEELEQAMNLAKFAMLNSAQNIDAQIQYTRAYGLKLLVTSKMSFLINSSKLKRMAENILKLDKNHPFGNYILGSLKLHLPAFSGGNNEDAFNLVHKAYLHAEDYQIGKEKFSMTLAKSSIKTKHYHIAKEVLEEITANKSSSDQRTLRRINQANQMLKTINNAA